MSYSIHSLLQVQTDNNAWPRFADRASTGHQLANAFQFGEPRSGTATPTGYNFDHPERHIYEEVGPPPHPPPYLTGGDMDTRISPHMDHHFRGSPASLCSRCSVRCSGNGHPPQPPSLPACNCMSPATAVHGMAPHLCNIHSSISQHQMQQQRTLNDSPSSQHMQCSPPPPCTLHHNEHLHHGLPCTLHHQSSTMGVTNQRYTGTITPGAAHHNQTQTSTKTKDSNRSLSPFAFLKKHNRDSKASTNTMLDNSSGKSVLMCSRKWLVAIVLTLVLIVVLSVAVGLVVTLTGM